MSKEIIFIGGLGGTGKSSLVNYFLENPVQGFSFFDFDKGKYSFPKGNHSHFEWREKQTKRWFEVAEEEYSIRSNITVIIGLGLFPKNTLDLNSGFNNFHFAYLFCDPSVRKERLINRGTPDHRKENNPWHKEYHEALEEYNAVRFDTGFKELSEVALEIRNWLNGLIM